jgi:hypothetical protein
MAGNNYSVRQPLPRAAEVSTERRNGGRLVLVHPAGAYRKLPPSVGVTDKAAVERIGGGCVVHSRRVVERFEPFSRGGIRTYKAFRDS